MRVLTRRWTDGFLDQSLAPGSCRIQPEAWVNLMPVEDMYFIRTPTLRLLANYRKEIGFRNVVSKVESRFRERGRNQKWVSCGIGTIIEVSDIPEVANPTLGSGLRVVFLAPAHPRCMERIVLPVQLVRKSTSTSRLDAGRIRFFSDVPGILGTADAVNSLLGWTPDSGVTLDSTALEQVLSATEQFLRCTPSTPRRLPLGSAITEKTPPPPTPPKPKPTACLMGYGNYAKTVIVPGVASTLNVVHIHELDPTQIGPCPNRQTAWDTSPVLRPECHPDVVLVAGYHHAHTPLAVDALSRGATVVLEKPLATTPEQVDQLLQAVQSSTGQLFACFQRRYLPFGRFIRQDLELSSGEPIDYHCIVYEEPLPLLHWYRWPASRTRLTSNGCHWIDHFLYLNNFVTARRMQVTRSRNDALAVTLELENDAFFTMVLTDRGSPRIGVQDHVELRSTSATVRISNSTLYVAERRDRVVRRERAGRLEAHATMYSAIGDAIIRGDCGDTALSIRVTAETVLQAEECARRALA